MVLFIVIITIYTHFILHGFIYSENHLQNTLNYMSYTETEMIRLEALHQWVGFSAILSSSLKTELQMT